MAVPSALHLALDLARTPLLTQAMRQQPVPADVLTLLRIAARNPEETRRASKLTGKSAAAVRAAAVLYLQQVLWTPDADHYRALGVKPDAPQETLLEHLRWLMKWLHPDQQHGPQEEAFAERVLAAWNALKTADRRTAYDQSRAGKSVKTSSSKKRRSHRVPWVAGAPEVPEGRYQMGWRIAAVVVAAIALVSVLAVDWTSLSAPRQVVESAGPSAGAGPGDGAVVRAGSGPAPQAE